MNDEELNQYIFNLFGSIFVEYMKSDNQNENIKLNQENKDLLKDVTTFIKIIQKYSQYYKKNANAIIDSISNDKAIEYLDMQTQKEIIYRVIIDTIEKIEEYTENKIDEIINSFLKEDDFYKDIFTKKYEDLEKKINSFKTNGKIYEPKTNLKQDINANENTISAQNYLNKEEAPTINAPILSTGKNQYIKRISLTENIAAPPPNA